MSLVESRLAEALLDVDDAYSDFGSAKYGNAANLLQRFVAAIDAEPLAGFLRVALPPSDFEAWYEQTMARRGGMAGSGSLAFPSDRAERVALQIGLIRKLSESERPFMDFTHTFCNAGYNNISAHFQEFGQTVLYPLTRDLRRLATTRDLPPILFQAMGSLPSSGDHMLDRLLAEAVDLFRDIAPSSRASAVERLWDAWERMKSLDVADNKRRSVTVLLERASSDPAFRAVLESEAKALTDLGNQFHIRHFEASKHPIMEPRYHDYLFHRLFALMYLLLFTTSV